VESVSGAGGNQRLRGDPPEEIGGDMEDLRSKRSINISLADASLLPPVRPSKIVCVGRNYRNTLPKTRNEVPTEPLIFFKPTTR